MRRFWREVHEWALIVLSGVTIGVVLALLTPGHAFGAEPSHRVQVKAMRVHVCEERGHGWHSSGSEYAGGLGWKYATWSEFRSPSFALTASLAPEWQQIEAMEKFAAKFGWPDQSGCWLGGYC
jgi:hypothetical protein